MNLIDLLPDYLLKTYTGKIAVTYGYDSEFEVKNDFDNDYDLMVYCLQEQAELWEDGINLVGWQDNLDWCGFARNIFEQFPIEFRRKVVKLDKGLSLHLPQDLIEKYR